jgi:hypothetical protein
MTSDAECCQAIEERYGFALPPEYLTMLEAGWCESVPWEDERLNYFIGETMWLKPKEILECELPEHAPPGLVPFATDESGDLWCWDPKQTRALGTPVLRCYHDAEAQLYAPNVIGWLYRRLLDYAASMQYTPEDERANMSEGHLRFWQDRLRSSFPGEWNHTLDAIRRRGEPVSSAEVKAILSRDEAFPQIESDESLEIKMHLPPKPAYQKVGKWLRVLVGWAVAVLAVLWSGSSLGLLVAVVVLWLRGDWSDVGDGLLISVPVNAAVAVFLFWMARRLLRRRPSLDGAARERVAPLDDPLFGRLDWNPMFGEWEGSFPAGGGLACHLCVSPRSRTDRSISDEARRMFARVIADLEGIHQRTADEFLPSWKENYPAESAMTREQFLLHLQVSGIFVESDGSILVEFDDMSGEDIFGGHGLGFVFRPDGTSEPSYQG